MYWFTVSNQFRALQIFCANQNTMLRRDYLQRQFEEFGKALALILAYKKRAEWEKFEKEINDAAQKFAFTEMASIEGMSVEHFISDVLESKKLEMDQKKILGKLLFEKLEFYMSRADSDKTNNTRTKCILLYQHLFDNLTGNEYDLDVHYKLGILKKL
jgi:hypothetical protein